MIISSLCSFSYSEELTAPLQLSVTSNKNRYRQGEPIGIDWFHITMRLAVLQQQAKGLQPNGLSSAKRWPNSSIA